MSWTKWLKTDKGGGGGGGGPAPVFLFCVIDRGLNRGVAPDIFLIVSSRQGDESTSDLEGNPCLLGGVDGARKGQGRKKQRSQGAVLGGKGPRGLVACGRNQGVCVSQNFMILGKSFPYWRAGPGNAGEAQP